MSLDMGWFLMAQTVTDAKPWTESADTTAILYERNISEQSPPKIGFFQ